MAQSSTGSGGAANINGILYQVLRTLKIVASYSLSGTKTQPLLIAEPIGGDLQLGGSIGVKPPNVTRGGDGESSP